MKKLITVDKTNGLTFKRKDYIFKNNLICNECNTPTGRIIISIDVGTQQQILLFECTKCKHREMFSFLPINIKVTSKIVMDCLKDLKWNY